MMSSEALKMFEKDGWEIDCESPLEISCGSSKASGWAAEIVMEYYENRCKGKHARLRSLQKSHSGFRMKIDSKGVKYVLCGSGSNAKRVNIVFIDPKSKNSYQPGKWVVDGNKS
jgi:hypothetical protein